MGAPVTETASTTSSLPASSEILQETAATGLDALRTTPDSERLYNPYDGLGAVLDSRRRGEGPVTFRLPQAPEYVFNEEATVQKRSISENICFYTGLGYLSGVLVYHDGWQYVHHHHTGATTGGMRGAVAALKAKPDHGIDTNRLRVNRFLNLSGVWRLCSCNKSTTSTIGKAGRTAGNSLGVLGLFFAASESGIDKLADGQIPDAMVTMLAGATTGAVFRSARGPRTAAVAGGVGMAAAGLLVVARKTIASGL